MSAHPPVPVIEPVAAALLQAAWTGDGLFLWARQGTLEESFVDLPGLPRDAKRSERVVAVKRTRTLRLKAEGIEVPLRSVLGLLAGLATEAPVSDAVRAYAATAKWGLELAADKRVVPTVRNDAARWVAVVSRPADRAKFAAIVQAMPPAGRLPTSERLREPLPSPRDVVRAFLDAVVDLVYRQGAYAGPARGWALDFANALRGSDPHFTVRDARSQATPGRIAAWAERGEAPLPQVGFALGLPGELGGSNKAAKSAFPLQIVVHPPGDPDNAVPVREAWRAGQALEIGDNRLVHPAESTLRGLARAARIAPVLERCLAGSEPADITLDTAAAWSFLDTARPSLQTAGFHVRLPAAFERAGRQRISARIRLTLASDRVDLASLLTFRWEVMVGARALDGKAFQALCASGRRIVQWEGEWVFLDPEELARLPADLTKPGTLSAPEALRALLTGFHLGVPVVADERLSVVLDALRSPPELPAPEGLLTVLRPYQAAGYAWLTALGALGLGALLADDMGLGKTIQLIAYLLGRTGGPTAVGRPTLVVCPTSVLGNWQREIAKFAPRLRVLRWHGADRDTLEVGEADVVLTTYGLLVRDVERLSAVQWDVVALDEAQSIKNPDARRARCARKLQARHRVALTGTPVENRLDELWSLLEFLVPGLLGGRARFQRQVALPIERFGDEEAAAQLKLTVSPFMLRRTKMDPNVAADLPDKVEHREFCVLTDEQRALYKAEVDSAMSEISTPEDRENSGTRAIARRGRVLAMLTALKQICNHPYHYLKKRDPAANPLLAGRSGKLERITELVEEIASCNERAVLFTQYREMGMLLQGHLEQVLQEPIPFLHGGTPIDARDEMVRDFQTEDDLGPTVLIVSLKAGGTGLTLTRATHVLHYDRWWNPAVEDQATDRAHRIGQKRTVLVHKLICEGTLEERIDAILERKRELVDAVVGSGERWIAELDDKALLDLVLLEPSALTAG